MTSEALASLHASPHHDHGNDEITTMVAGGAKDAVKPDTMS